MHVNTLRKESMGLLEGSGGKGLDRRAGPADPGPARQQNVRDLNKDEDTKMGNRRGRKSQGL